MDVEKTIEFLLEQQAASQARFDAHMEQFRAEQAQFRVEYEDRQKQYEEQHTREITAIRNELRRGIRLSVEEARRERVRRRELADGLAELRNAHQATELSLKQFIDSLNRPRTNGHD